MRKGLSICDWTVQVAAMRFLIIWILLANGSLAIAREEHDTTLKRRNLVRRIRRTHTTPQFLRNRVRR